MSSKVALPLLAYRRVTPMVTVLVMSGMRYD
jgi:hypothetical protein